MSTTLNIPDLRERYDVYQAAHAAMLAFNPEYQRAASKKKLTTAMRAHKTELSQVLKEAYSALRVGVFLADLLLHEDWHNQQAVISAAKKELGIHG